MQFHLYCCRLLKLQCSDNPNLVCPINYSTNALPCHIAADVRARDVCMHYSDDKRDNLEVGQHERCSKSNDSTSKMFYAITHSQRKPRWLLLGLICSLLRSFLLKMWQNCKKRTDISVQAVLVSSETDIGITDHRLKKEVWCLLKDRNLVTNSKCCFRHWELSSMGPINKFSVPNWEILHANSNVKAHKCIISSKSVIYIMLKILQTWQVGFNSKNKLKLI